MQVNIQTQKSGKTISDFWNHVHFPTDGSSRGPIAQDCVALYARLHTRAEDIANAYSRFVEMASPEVPTMYQRSEIADAGELTFCMPEEICSFNGGNILFDALLPQNRGIYFKLIRQK